MVTDCKHGVERSHRLLENHADFTASDVRHLAERHLCNVHYFVVFLKNRLETRFALVVNRLTCDLVAVFIGNVFHDRFLADGCFYR